MRVEEYFNTEVLYEESKEETDEYNNTVYEEPIIIRCRIEGKLKYIRNEQNDISVSEQSFWTTHSIKPKDRITVMIGNKKQQQYVIAVNPIYGFRGELIYYEAYV